MPQPIINNEFGCLLSVGVIVNGDRMEIVEPVFSDDAAVPVDTLCVDACNSWETQRLSLFLDCLTSDAEVRFIQAEGMVDGLIPNRIDYAPGAHVGTRAAGPMPSNVTGLIDYYCEVTDIVLPKTRMTIGKTFVPGVPQSEVTGDILSTVMIGKYTSFGAQGLTGWMSAANGAKHWYRANAATPRTPSAGVQIKRTAVVVVRNYVATQRRRLTPH